MMTHIKLVLVASLIIILGGCMPSLTLNDGTQGGLLSEFDEVADEFSCNLSANATHQLSNDIQEKSKNDTKATCLQQYKDSKHLRLIRAQLMAVVILRYGLSNIDLHSEEKEVDKSRLMVELKQVIAGLKKTKGQLTSAEQYDYPVIKSDLIIAYIHFSFAAIKPFTKEAGNLLTASRLDQVKLGGTIIKQALKNALYREAYAAEMKELRLSNKYNGASISSQWAFVNNQLIEQCKNISDDANLCKI